MDNHGTWRSSDTSTVTRRHSKRHAAMVRWSHAALLRIVAAIVWGAMQSKSAAEKHSSALMNNYTGDLDTESSEEVNQTEKNRSDGVPYGEKVWLSITCRCQRKRIGVMRPMWRVWTAWAVQNIGKVGANLIYCDMILLYSMKPDEIPFLLAKD